MRFPLTDQSPVSKRVPPVCKSERVLVVCDLDGTLVDQIAAAQAWAAEFVEDWKLPDAAAECIALRLRERRPKGSLFQDIAEDWSLRVTGEDIAAAYRRRMPELVRCADADREALRRLRAAGWSLGIATNGTVANQEGKIRATGLASLVDAWVSSEEVGARKPDPEIFRILARRMGHPLEGWMVGDSLEHDVAGGAAAGLRTIWIAGGDRPLMKSYRPTLMARSTAEAADLILAPSTS
jgi:HAD superfamily hydrolase (TIGR01509 family)